jgi:asparaginyl-tRNA synthetase
MQTVAGWLSSKDLTLGVVGIRTHRGSEKYRIEGDALKDQLASIEVESSVRAKVRYFADGPVLDGLEVVHRSAPFPIDLRQDHGRDLAKRHLWTRSPRMAAIVRARHKIMKAIRETLEANGFFNVQTPITTTMECVCSGTIFEAPFYEHDVFLNQSPWMYVDNLVSCVEKVYAVMTSFRKEFKQSPFHLAEVCHVQCDQAWVTHDESMAFEERLVSAVVHRTITEALPELQLLGRDIAPLSRIAPPFPRVAYTEAVDIINKNGGKIEWGEDVDKKSQNILADRFDGPFFLIEPPHPTTNFFFNKVPGNPRVAMTHDLYVPGLGEVIGGGTRISDIDQLMTNLGEFGHDPADYAWYVESKRLGPIPHTGFNFGFDRLAMWLLDLKDIREVVPFPRLPLDRPWP